jgi:hypothetical protein
MPITRSSAYCSRTLLSPAKNIYNIQPKSDLSDTEAGIAKRVSWASRGALDGTRDPTKYFPGHLTHPYAAIHRGIAEGSALAFNATKRDVSIQAMSVTNLLL